MNPSRPPLAAALLAAGALTMSAAPLAQAATDVVKSTSAVNAASKAAVTVKKLEAPKPPTETTAPNAFDKSGTRELRVRPPPPPPPIIPADQIKNKVKGMQ